MKYESWILKETKIVEYTELVETSDNEGKVKTRLLYVYECPHCHKTYSSGLSNKMTLRKCRYCNKPVSSYKGEIIDYIWL